MVYAKIPPYHILAHALNVLGDIGESLMNGIWNHKPWQPNQQVYSFSSLASSSTLKTKSHHWRSTYIYIQHAAQRWCSECRPSHSLRCRQ